MSIISQAEDELRRIKFGEEDSRVMIGILRQFLDQWDSGGAVAAVVPILRRLLNGQPLSPLTGDDDEWFVHDMDGLYAQNIRCGSVFKDSKDGPAYDINARGRPTISFPYSPDTSDPVMPLIEFTV